MESCNKAEPVDYFGYYSAEFGKQIFQSISESETEKPISQRNYGVMLFSNLLELGCDLVKYGMNQNICKSIGSPKKVGG